MSRESIEDRRAFWRGFAEYAPELGIPEDQTNEFVVPSELPKNAYLKLSPSKDKISIYISLKNPIPWETTKWLERNADVLKKGIRTSGDLEKRGSEIRYRKDISTVGYESPPSKMEEAYRWMKANCMTYTKAIAAAS